MDIEKHYKNDTLILMADGSIKRIDSIQEAEYVMGPNYTSKQVIGKSCIVGTTVKITPNKGYSFICSDTNMLSLTGTKPFLIMLKPDRILRYEIHYSFRGQPKTRAFSTLEESQEFSDSLPKDIFIMSINEYVHRSKTHRRACFLYHMGMNFPEQNVPMDPYILGYWLGDGASACPQITTADFEVVDYYSEKLPEYNLKLSKQQKSISYTIIVDKPIKKKERNTFMTFIKNFNLLNNKHIPDLYKLNSRQVRLEVLAGLIDSDGHYDKKNKCLEISQKRVKLSDDIEYLCYSLGFMITRKPTFKSCKYKNEKKYGLYQRMVIFGDGVEEIPTKIARKKIEQRQIKKRATCFKFEVEPCGEDICYGIKVEGEPELLSGEFLVL